MVKYQEILGVAADGFTFGQSVAHSIPQEIIRT